MVGAKERNGEKSDNIIVRIRSRHVQSVFFGQSLILHKNIQQLVRRINYSANNLDLYLHSRVNRIYICQLFSGLIPGYSGVSVRFHTAPRVYGNFKKKEDQTGQTVRSPFCIGHGHARRFSHGKHAKYFFLIGRLVSTLRFGPFDTK